jgi:hypothetical protein
VVPTIAAAAAALSSTNNTNTHCIGKSLPSSHSLDHDGPAAEALPIGPAAEALPIGLAAEALPVGPAAEALPIGPAAEPLHTLRVCLVVVVSLVFCAEHATIVIAAFVTRLVSTAIHLKGQTDKTAPVVQPTLQYS